MLKRLTQLAAGGTGGGDLLADLGLAILRVTTGLFLAVGHGWPKAMAPSGFIDNAVRGNFPVPEVSGWFAILGELVGGVLLAAGLATRVAALWIIGVFIGAAFVSKAEGFESLDKFFLPAPTSPEPALLFLLIGVTFLLTGSGRFGADRFLRRK